MGRIFFSLLAVFASCSPSFHSYKSTNKRHPSPKVHKGSCLKKRHPLRTSAQHAYKTDPNYPISILTDHPSITPRPNVSIRVSLLPSPLRSVIDPHTLPPQQSLYVDCLHSSTNALKVLFSDFRKLSLSQIKSKSSCLPSHRSQLPAHPAPRNQKSRQLRQT